MCVALQLMLWLCTESRDRHHDEPVGVAVALTDCENSGEIITKKAAVLVSAVLRLPGTRRHSRIANTG